MRWLAVILVLVVAAACGDGDDGGAADAIATTSPTIEGSTTMATTGPSTGPSESVLALSIAEFADGAPIPVANTCDGEDIAPTITWTDAPAGTQSFALIVDDPDAPRAEPFVHWVVHGLPSSATSVPSDDVSGVNDFGRRGWGGPCPPRGDPHRYIFTLYAVAEAPVFTETPTKGDVLAEIDGSILAQATYSGTYRRR